MKKIISLFSIITVLALFTSATHAEDYSNNIGFMKNPPKELKEKFPMCDQFLDVKWIRQFPNGGWVGTVTADVYFGDKKEQRELVVMQEQKPSQNSDKKILMVFDVSKTTFRGAKLEELIKAADRIFSRYWAGYGEASGQGFTVEKNDILKSISKVRLQSDLNEQSFTKFAFSVCVVLPRGNVGWVIENRIGTGGKRYILGHE